MYVKKNAVVCLVLGVVCISAIGCADMVRNAYDYDKIDQREHELEVKKSQQEYEMGMVDKMCKPEALVGTTSGFGVAIKAKRDELSELEGSIDANTYTRLSQELQGYTARLELLNQEIKMACNQNAVCLARDSNSGICYDADNKYQQKIKEANSLEREVQTIDLSQQ
jgi:stringent starvation protein B